MADALITLSSQVSAKGLATDPGLILVIVVIPVVLLALIWLGYIFWLIFHNYEILGLGRFRSNCGRNWRVWLSIYRGWVGHVLSRLTFPSVDQPT